MPTPPSTTLPPPLLDPAPLARSPYRLLWLFAAGLATTLLAIAATVAIEYFWQADLFSFTINGFCPGGAMLVGLVAGTGFACAALYYGIRVTPDTAFLIFVLLLPAYFLAQYADFLLKGPLVDLATGHTLGFWRYYHLVTMSISFKSQYSETPGNALKEAGYLIRLVELLGFAIMGTVPSLLTRTQPYCPICERFMKSRRIATISLANVEYDIFRDLFDVDRSEKGRTRLAQTGAFGGLLAAAKAADFPAFYALLQSVALPSKDPACENVRIEMTLSHCRQCSNGHIDLNLITKESRSKTGTKISRADLPRPFLQQLLTALPTLPK